MRTLLITIICITLPLLDANAQFSKLKKMKTKGEDMALNAMNIPSDFEQSQDQGYTSTLHQKYAGQIVFAKSLDAIKFKNEDEKRFESSFSGSDPIYARLYLHRSIGNTPHNGEKSFKSILMYDMYIDGQMVPFKKSFGMYRHIPDNERTYYTEEIETNDELNIWTSWRPALLPLETDDELKYGNVNIMARCFALALLDQSVGNHEVELRMYARDFATNNKTKVLASGKFNISLSDNDKKKLAFKYAPPLPKDEWRGSGKKALIDQLTLAFEQELRKKPLIVGISGVDWKEGSYKLTGQRYRKIAGWAVFDDGDGDGQVPITTFNFISDYSGGSWSKLRFDSHCLGCPNWDVEVAAVKALQNN